MVWVHRNPMQKLLLRLHTHTALSNQGGNLPKGAGGTHALNGATLIPFIRCTTHVPHKGVRATNAIHLTGNGIREKGTIIEHRIFVGKGLGNSLTQGRIHSCEKCVTLTNTQTNGNHEQTLTHKLIQSSREKGVGHCIGIGPCKNGTTINNSNNT